VKERSQLVVLQALVDLLGVGDVGLVHEDDVDVVGVGGEIAHNGCGSDNVLEDPATVDGLVKTGSSKSFNTTSRLNNALGSFLF